MKTQEILKQTRIIVLAAIIGLTVAYAGAWTEPTEAPTGGNVEAPINVGTSSQYKTGAFAIGGIFETDTETHLAIDGSGVKIGDATSPSESLDVVGNIKASGGITAGSDITTSGGILAGGQNVCLQDGSNCPAGGGGSLWTSSGSDIYYNTGNVGVGTAMPGYKLSFGPAVNNNILALAEEATSAMRGIGATQGGTPVVKYGIGFWANLAPIAPDITNTRMFIDASTGNVGIGTMIPGAELQVNGNVIGTAAPTVANHLANKNYVDNAVSGGGFGTWLSGYAIMGGYVAATDGFVVAYDTSGLGVLIGYTEMSPGSGLVQVSRSDAAAPGQSVTFPVKKSCMWSVQNPTVSGTEVIRFLPLGT
jgi:hypothetical protein